MVAFGIDLGTSDSAAAVLRVGRPVVIPSVEGVEQIEPEERRVFEPLRALHRARRPDAARSHQ